MSDTAERHTSDPALSPETRLVAGALERVQECGCHESAVTLLRGFDAQSRSRARAVRDRLRSTGVRARTIQASIAASPEHLSGAADEEPLSEHACVFVDVTPSRSSEAARLAGWFATPLVSLAPGPATTQHEPLLKLRMQDDRSPVQIAFPSVSGLEAAVAFASVRITPNQPERGVLRLQVASALPRQLDRGSSLELRPLGDRMRVTGQETTGQRKIWFADEVTVSQYSGVHVVERDGMPVADLGRAVTITYHPEGLVHHRV